jgi:hypothetical protein
MKRLLGVLTLIAVGTACSERVTGPDRAKAVISNLESFQRAARFILQTEVPFQTAFDCLTRAEVERAPVTTFAIRRGWVQFESREASLGFGVKKACPSLTLTAAGRAASAEWTRHGTGTGNGVAWAVPIGRREFASVTNFTTAPEGAAQVEFSWRWSPNEAGNALRAIVPQAGDFFSEIRTGRAACGQATGEWRCQLAMWTTPADAGDFQP